MLATRVLQTGGSHKQASHRGHDRVARPYKLPEGALAAVVETAGADVTVLPAGELALRFA